MEEILQSTPITQNPQEAQQQPLNPYPSWDNPQKKDRFVDKGFKFNWENLVNPLKHLKNVGEMTFEGLRRLWNGKEYVYKFKDENGQDKTLNEKEYQNYVANKKADLRAQEDAQKAIDEAKAEAEAEKKSDREWQSTFYQRSVKDAQAAGINPNAISWGASSANSSSQRNMEGENQARTEKMQEAKERLLQEIELRFKEDQAAKERVTNIVMSVFGAAIKAGSTIAGAKIAGENIIKSATIRGNAIVDSAEIRKGK